MYKRIELFVGGSTDKNLSENYKNAAILLGQKMNERKYKIIFDGCHGLPSLTYEQLENRDDAFIIYNGSYQVSDYIKKVSFPAGVSFWYGPTIRTIDEQSNVTRAFINACDALFFMKGTMGTIAEVMQAIDRKKNKEHDKPIVILNIDHEWDELINLLDTFQLQNLYYTTDNVIDGLNYIEKNLYDEKSSFYQNYLRYSVLCERDYPIIEEIDSKSRTRK